MLRDFVFSPGAPKLLAQMRWQVGSTLGQPRGQRYSSWASQGRALSEDENSLKMTTKRPAADIRYVLRLCLVSQRD
jgi:hypothetical protein